MTCQGTHIITMMMITQTWATHTAPKNWSQSDLVQSTTALRTLLAMPVVLTPRMGLPGPRLVAYAGHGLSHNGEGYGIPIYHHKDIQRGPPEVDPYIRPAWDKALYVVKPVSPSPPQKNPWIPEWMPIGGPEPTPKVDPLQKTNKNRFQS